MGLGAFQSTARQRAPGLGRRAYGHPLPDYQARDQASRPDPLVHHGLRASPSFVIGMSITYAQINKALITHFLHVLLGHDPPCAARAGVEGQEVGPRRLEPESHVARIGRLDGDHPLLQGLISATAITLERE